MAGKPGRSGGARPGAGRKKKAAQPVVGALAPTPTAAPAAAPPPAVVPEDMLDLLQKVALGQVSATSLQVRAAIAAVQYTHTKRGDGGKKDEAAGRAKKAAGGKFAAAAPPLKLVRGG